MDKNKLITTIEAVILEQLASFKDDLSKSDMKLIAVQCSREAARRMICENPESLTP